MAKVVMINAQSYRPGVNEIGDIIEIQDDDVITGGMGYATFQVIAIQNLTAAEIRAKLGESWPVRMRISEEETTGDEVAGRYWWNITESKWYLIENQRKYAYSVAGLSSEQLITLQNPATSAEDKLNVIATIPATFSTLTENNTTTIDREAPDLT